MLASDFSGTPWRDCGIADDIGISDPREEIGVAQVHDCFSLTELLAYEDLGRLPDVAQLDLELGAYLELAPVGEVAQVVAELDHARKIAGEVAERAQLTAAE